MEGAGAEEEGGEGGGWGVGPTANRGDSIRRWHLKLWLQRQHHRTVKESNVRLLRFYHTVGSNNLPSGFKTVSRQNTRQLVATKISTGIAENRRSSKRITEAGKHFSGPDPIRMRLRWFPCRCETRLQSEFDRLLKYELHFRYHRLACRQKYS